MKLFLDVISRLTAAFKLISFPNSSSIQICSPQVIIICYLESKNLEMSLEDYPVKRQKEKKGSQGSEISRDLKGNQRLISNQEGRHFL